MTMSILDQIESISRRTACPECGGTILTGCTGTEEEHDYCDACDWKQDRSEIDTWYTWRTDAAYGALWADSADAALADIISGDEWGETDSEREVRDIADGAWLTIFDAGVPVLRRGQMP